MISTALNSILIRKYNGFKVYIHNLAKFDVYFLFKILNKLGNMQPIIHKGRLIQIKLSYGDINQYNIVFRDSYQILLTSLAKLAVSFNVEEKGIFPYSFVNENNLDYIGEVPDFKYFNNITLDQYREYITTVRKNWNLKIETIRYCEQDCRTLFQVLSSFSDLIFTNFKANIHKYPTLPGLSLGIYRMKYITENTIPQIAGQIYKDIRKSYTGGGK